MSQITHPQRSIVILGAGVVGLTVAYALSQDDSNKITVVARDMPEHFDSQGWASPWAGANWSPMGDFDERTSKWERITFERLWSMIPTGLVMKLTSRAYFETAVSTEWWKDIVRDFRVLSSDQEKFPEGAKFGFAFTTVSTKPTRYLRWLKGELTQRGVSFILKNVSSIEAVAAIGGDDSIVINCSGLGAKSLLGVEDNSVFPIRGQTIVVDAPHVKECIADLTPGNGKGPSECTYIIPRPDGSVILGGTFQADVWETAVNHHTARAIYERCTALEPALLPSKGTTILSHNVGLRPARKGGPRVEVENVELPLANDLVPVEVEGTRVKKTRICKVIHCYGFGSAGYQNSWGVSEEVKGLLASITIE
ncbi:FAD dependent oxidoreductase [Schizopora paradoxa]|uniref:FAD dependent oxidoreductase n=1 Tax=Schizopora paradoxa TaxID=27342 RepID=A0A0H2SSG7_9AGAM|nr:FAD dependent oxidoreductase [Schizopora paradoxa]